MAFTSSVRDRSLDDMRFRSLDGQQFPTTYAPLRSSELSNAIIHTQPAPTSDLRAGLTRRFTMDAMNPSQPSPWDQSRLPRIPVPDNLEILASADVCQYLPVLKP